ncbi:hypothetical protein RRG08_021979 [Elysia crispata]|uniref:Uncharacterized protein n=1 Tax=Elysia crispata TaxID=231223 RepID=A0AAE1D8J7_9GAST|nr:hypothetical protein RRG08_059548 [Elysia crispata]KAK3798642.1 hypothetical protein RRG08_021979 [Elysia crispata]
MPMKMRLFEPGEISETTASTSGRNAAIIEQEQLWQTDANTSGSQSTKGHDHSDIIFFTITSSNIYSKNKTDYGRQCHITIHIKKRFVS